MSELTQEQIAYIKSYDFMRLGHAINAKQANAAGMCAQRMQRTAEQVGLSDFDRILRNIKLCIGKREWKTALDLMTQLTAKRVQLLRSLNNQ